LILADDEFVALEEKKLARAYLTFKKREKLNLIISIKFNDGLITLVNDDNTLLLTQSKQFHQIKLINLSSSINLTSSREEIRKIITLKDQYVAQRARDVYIATISQSEASFCQSATREVRRLWYSAIDGPAMNRNWLVSKLREITRLETSTSCN
jgi:hypothetical protein